MKLVWLRAKALCGNPRGRSSCLSRERSRMPLSVEQVLDCHSQVTFICTQTHDKRGLHIQRNGGIVTHVDMRGVGETQLTLQLLLLGQLSGVLNSEISFR